MGRHRRHEVAGDEHLHALVEQVIGDLAGEVLDGRHRLDAVGHPGGVAEIDDVLGAEGAPSARAHDGETAYAGVEDP